MASGSPKAARWSPTAHERDKQAAQVSSNLVYMPPEAATWGQTRPARSPARGPPLEAPQRPPKKENTAVYLIRCSIQVRRGGKENKPFF